MGKRKKVQTNELLQRYALTKSAVYDRMYKLNIKSFQKDGKSYITGEQLQLMDALHAHINGGGKIASFVAARITRGEITPPQSKAVASAQRASEAAIESDETIPPASQAICVTQPQTGGEIVNQNQQEIVEVSEATFAEPQAEPLAYLEQQKTKQVSASDLGEADERSQYRAAAKIIAEENLTRFYEATEEFTIPGLREHVLQHRQSCKQSRSNQAIGDNLNDFLSQKFRAAGLSGLTNSHNYKSNQSPTSSNANNKDDSGPGH